MVQCRGCFGFPPKALQSLSVARHVVGQEFERDETAQSRVLSLIDNTHSAPAEFLQDAVMRNGLADKRLGVRHLPSILGCRAEASQRTRTLVFDGKMKTLMSGAQSGGCRGTVFRVQYRFE